MSLYCQPSTILHSNKMRSSAAKSWRRARNRSGLVMGRFSPADARTVPRPTTMALCHRPILLETKWTRCTGRGSGAIRAGCVRGAFRPNIARCRSQEDSSCENWRGENGKPSKSAAKASPIRPDARGLGLGSSSRIVFRSVRGSQRSSKPDSSQGAAGNGGPRLDSACAAGTPEMRLLGDHRPRSGSDPWPRCQISPESHGQKQTQENKQQALKQRARVTSQPVPRGGRRFHANRKLIR